MIWIGGWYLLTSMITFAVYGLDKHKAKVDRWRIRERTLHMCELIGGWPGAFVAQRYFHHKLRKTQFILVFWSIVALHIAIWAIVFYRCQYP